MFHNGRPVAGETRRDVTAQSLLRRDDRELELCSNGITLALEDDGPVNGERASFLVDIMNPCYRMRDVVIMQGTSVSASVGQLPFNFEIGDAIDGITHKPPATAHGELNVHLGDCDGPVVASLPLASAVNRHGTTELPPTRMQIPADAAANADLCFDFTQQGIDPFWVLDWVQLVLPSVSSTTSPNPGKQP